MSDQFTRYEQDLISFIKSGKTIIADKIPIAQGGRLFRKYFSCSNLLINR